MCCSISEPHEISLYLPYISLYLPTSPLHLPISQHHDLGAPRLAPLAPRVDEQEVAVVRRDGCADLPRP